MNTMSCLKVIRKYRKMTQTKQFFKNAFKLFNNEAYNEMILSQEDTFCFQIAKQANITASEYGDAIQAWENFHDNFIQFQHLEV